MISTSHLKISSSSINPAENPSTGFLFNSEYMSATVLSKIERQDIVIRTHRYTRMISPSVVRTVYMFSEKLHYGMGTNGLDTHTIYIWYIYRYMIPYIYI